MPTQITRAQEDRSFIVTQSAYLSTNVIHMGQYSMGTLITPAAIDSSANIGFYVSDKLEGTYVPLRDSAGNAVEISSPAASQAYAFPAELAAVSYLKLWQQASEAHVRAEAQRTFVVIVKG